ncbi:MAG: hypothetical protein HKN00_12745 [Flavobacteriaceae bacterium]|nr:hypothetical protein [Bacteroidia bacterium]NNF76050.1 hypothetical protein [Flavobacteriaceae bacterium]MBT8269890.1 hypothetical protein [Bacteroidia bacterium]MBT8288131.1 hypothetical protein [Bacteroidia bacterium]NNK69479.1 hypothetical protein [Flavobacteriaceae bacterium]
MKKINLFFLFAFLLVLNSVAQPETSISNEKEQEGWSFTATPYVWLSGFRAETSFRQISPEPVNADFSDIRDSVELTGSLHLEAKKGRFYIIGDVSYFNSDKDGFLDTEPTPTRLFVDQWVTELGGGFNLFNTEDSFLVDALAGWRNTRSDNRLTIAGIEEFNRSINTNDLFLGARLQILSDLWGFLLRGDLGGFGWGSELSWRINAIGTYNFCDWFALNFGIQALGIDYQEDNYRHEMMTVGFTAGGSFKF